MGGALERLKSRLADVAALDAVSSLLVWDQRTTMPPAGGSHRAEHLATMQRMSHELLIDPETGRLLDELAALEDSLDPDSIDASTIRVARRDFEKAVRLPAGLRAEMTRAASESAPAWMEAKATSNYDLFLPVLERNIELRMRYIDCFEPRDEPYDILLDDFEPEMRTAEVTRIFAEIRDELVPLIASLRDREVDDSFLTGEYPIDAQIALDNEIVDLFGHRPATWRLDPTEHPFAAGAGIDD